MASAASSEHPYAELKRLFLAADRHLSKVDPAMRGRIMERVVTVMTSGSPAAFRALARFVEAVGVPAGPRLSFMGTVRNAIACARHQPEDTPAQA